MNKLFLLVLGFIAFGAHAATSREGSLTGAPCSDAWNRSLESLVETGDRSGHGPDLGSDEWKSVVEFRLGVRGKPGVPARDSTAWCTYLIAWFAEQRRPARRVPRLIAPRPRRGVRRR